LSTDSSALPRRSSRSGSDDPILVQARGKFHFVITSLGVPRDLWEDAYQGAAVGLLVAASRFDPGRGVQLNTYAHGYIVKEVRRATGRDGRRRVETCEIPLASPPDTRVHPDQVGFAAIEEAEEAAAVQHFVAGLDENDRLLYERLYVEGVSQAALGRELGRTPMQISRWVSHFHQRARIALAGAVQIAA